jgi:hypothetical protein
MFPSLRWTRGSMTANTACRGNRGGDRVDPATSLSPPPRTVPPMSCTVIPSPLMDLLATVATHPELPADRLDPEQYDVAVEQAIPDVLESSANVRPLPR